MNPLHILCGLLSLIALWPNSNAVNQVAVSESNTCVLSGINVFCWGLGEYGILGNGNTSSLYTPPTSPIDLGDAFYPKMIDCGEHHCCSISYNGTLKCWGLNEYGQLGHGDDETKGDDPGEMGNALPFTDLASKFVADSVSCGAQHTCVLSTDRNIKCFGANDDGQLGYGHTDNVGDHGDEMGEALETVKLGTNFDVIQVSAGGEHSCALSADLTVKCWGKNFNGQLGQGDTETRGDESGQMFNFLTPIDLGTNFQVTRIHSGWSHVCALSIDQDVKCWGANKNGQLGLGDTDHRGISTGQMGDDLPLVNLGDDFVPQMMGGGGRHISVLSTNGTLKSYGFNDDGRLGYGDTEQRGDNATGMGNHLEIVDMGSGYISVSVTSSCCNAHSCSFLQNDTDFLGLKCWGLNEFGQLGLNDIENRGDETNEMGDWLPFISITFDFPTSNPTADPTNVPTSEPTTNFSFSADPTIEPTTDPTVRSFSEPTSNPSADPTTDPTADPTLDPTQNPTNDPTENPTIFPSHELTNDPTVMYGHCTLLSLNVIDFGAFSAADLQEDTETQEEIANITKMAITQTVLALDKLMDPQSFIVSHHNVTGHVNLVEEVLQRSLLIVQRLCADAPDNLDALMLVIDSKGDDIGICISEKLAALYLDDDSTTTTPPTKPATSSDENSNSMLMIVIGGVTGAVLVVCILICVIVQFISQMRLQQQMADVIGEEVKMTNGLIVSVPIGHYQNNRTEAEVQGYFPDLPVERDVEHLKELAAHLNYRFLSIENKLSWTEDEVKDFVSNQVGAEFFGDHQKAKYDGLIVAFSGHGVKDHIVTSDLKQMDRTAIHRGLSNAFPKIREFPRVYLFDACDGSGDCKSTLSLPSKALSKACRQHVDQKEVEIELSVPSRSFGENDDEKDGDIQMSTMSNEMAKNLELNDVYVSDEWTQSGKNPDYGLTVVHASNKGFVAKMKQGSVGSYLTYFFTKVVMQYHKTMGLAHMLEEINEALHDNGKQQIRTEFFSKTRNLRFEINVFH